MTTSPPTTTTPSPTPPQIQILYSDNDIIVVNKPCKLRSVPGHANPPSSSSRTKRPRDPIATNNVDDNPRSSHKQTAQETWIDAIRIAATSSDSSERIQPFLQTLSSLSNPPRKFPPFLRFCLRNKHHFPFEITPHDVEEAFKCIKRAYVPVVPEPTKRDESVLGQLKLRGYEEDGDIRPIRVVHRLDCETSGVLVFARTDKAASDLCRAWRRNDNIQKTYLAKVKHWPPYHEHGIHEGMIDVPLAPHKTERLKWDVTSVEDGGKPSQTVWSVSKDHDEKPQNDDENDNDDDDDDDDDDQAVILTLRPKTGRTHQLRIHCAAIGSGIVGDSLYGDEPVEWNPQLRSGCVLCLHAWKLSFPHPDTKEIVEFCAPMSGSW